MGVLDKIAKRFTTKSSSALQRDIDRLRDEKRSYVRAMPPLRETAYARVNELHTEAQSRLDAHIMAMGHQVPPLSSDHPSLAELAKLHVLATPELVERMHAVIDRAPGFAEISEAEYQKKVDGWDKEIADRELELERREKAAKAEAAAAELKALEGEEDAA